MASAWRLCLGCRNPAKQTIALALVVRSYEKLTNTLAQANNESNQRTDIRRSDGKKKKQFNWIFLRMSPARPLDLYSPTSAYHQIIYSIATERTIFMRIDFFFLFSISKNFASFAHNRSEIAQNRGERVKWIYNLYFKYEHIAWHKGKWHGSMRRLCRRLSTVPSIHKFFSVTAMESPQENNFN